MTRLIWFLFQNTSEEFVDVEGDGEMAAQQAEAEDSLAQDLQLTPENSDDEDRPGQ